mgnify:CR=1 FL=1
MADTGFFNPQTIASHLKLAPGMQVADFGCGSGEIAIMFAQAVAPDGHVTAIDVLPSALESLTVKVKAEKITNIISLRANLEVPGSSGLVDQSQDLVFMANILWQSPNKSDILAEAKRVLKSGGTLAVIEWKSKLSEGELTALMKENGFTITTVVPGGTHHYGVLAINS